MLTIDLTGKHALVAGVADDGGFGWAIAKAFAEAGAKVSVAAWPPALGIFKTMLERGKFDESLKLANGGKMQFAKIYPLDAEYDRMDDVPQELREFDVVVFDPPRQGAQAQAQKLASSRVPIVVGVSCNAATFARDARLLVDGGYRLERVTPVDQFRHTPHVELVARFVR